MKRNKGISLMNILGMTLAFVVSIAIYVYILHELSYDRYHSRADKVYRVTYRYQNAEGYDIHWARMNQPWVNQMTDEFPEIEKLVRFQSFRSRDVSVGQVNYREQFSYAVDQEVFDLFDLPIVLGSKAASLQPYTVVLTETAADKYFGDQDPTGKSIMISNDMGAKDRYMVTAVIKDPPDNTHLPIHMLTSINDEQDRRGWAYTYILLNDEANISSVESKIADFISTHGNENDEGQLTVHFQPLKNIHLYSHLSREIVANGDVKNLMIFALVGLFLLIIASVNFINLNVVRSLDRIKEFGLRKSLGAHGGEHQVYLVLDAIVLCFLSAAFATIIFFLGLRQFQQFLGHQLVFDPLWLLPLLLLLVVT
ncbi:MAG: ABC transporter permease, partial [Bacteroidota bacterium]